MSNVKLPVFNRSNVVRGMSTESNDEFEEYLGCTADNDFFFRIREYKHGEGNEIYVIGLVRRDRQPATWIDFPVWIKLE